jgi:protein CpxP
MFQNSLKDKDGERRHRLAGILVPNPDPGGIFDFWGNIFYTGAGFKPKRHPTMIYFPKTKSQSMKKAILLLAIAITGVLAVQAQGGGGGFQRRTPEERLKMTKEKLADLKLDKDQTTKSDSVFMDHFRAQDKMFEEMRAAGGGGDRDQMREKMQKLAAERDEKLKKIFTEDQFKKWKDEIEPALRPQRGGGGGGRSGGNN